MFDKQFIYHNIVILKTLNIVSQLMTPILNNFFQKLVIDLAD